MMFETIKNDIEKRMASTTQSFKSDMQGIRAGRASPSMLDSIKVEAYGQKMNINQLGNITTPDSRTINVDIWDASNVGFVEIKSDKGHDSFLLDVPDFLKALKNFLDRSYLEKKNETRI